MKKRRLSLLALSLMAAIPIFAQSPTRVEYFLDTDPGYGLAQIVNNISVGNNELTFDLSSAEAGAHILYVRAQDSEGRWSSTIARPLFINRLQDIVRVEYFFDDADPGIGLATPLPLPDQSYKAHLDWQPELDVSALELGEHTLSVRALDAFGTWTDIMTRSFTIVEGPEPPAPEGDLQRLEYFFDVDPGYGLGRQLLAPNTGRNVYVMSFEGLELGAHLLCLRAQDKQDRWSATISRPIYVTPVYGIAALEYFFDAEDPGEGNAYAVAVSDPKESEISFDISTDELIVGEHTLSVRAKGLDGRWSVISSEPFHIDNADGIRKVTFDMPFRMSLNRSSFTINATAGSDKNDCRVELFDVSGKKLASAIWPKSKSSLTLNVNPTGTLVVKVTDLDNKKQLVKQIKSR